MQCLFVPATSIDWSCKQLHLEAFWPAYWGPAEAFIPPRFTLFDIHYLSNSDHFRVKSFRCLLVVLNLESALVFLILLISFGWFPRQERNDFTLLSPNWKYTLSFTPKLLWLKPHWLIFWLFSSPSYSQKASHNYFWHKKNWGIPPMCVPHKVCRHHYQTMPSLFSQLWWLLFTALKASLRSLTCTSGKGALVLFPEPGYCLQRPNSIQCHFACQPFQTTWSHSQKDCYVENKRSVLKTEVRIVNPWNSVLSFQTTKVKGKYTTHYNPCLVHLWFALSSRLFLGIKF